MLNYTCETLEQIVKMKFNNLEKEFNDVKDDLFNNLSLSPNANSNQIRDHFDALIYRNQIDNSELKGILLSYTYATFR